MRSFGKNVTVERSYFKNNHCVPPHNRHIAKFFLSILVTGALVLPLAHALFHIQLKIEEQTHQPYAPGHTHQADVTFGTSCSPDASSNVHCLLCTLTHARAGAEKSDVSRSPNVALFRFEPRFTFVNSLFEHTAIRGPPLRA